MNKTYPLLPTGHLMSADNLNSIHSSWKELDNLGGIRGGQILLLDLIFIFKSTFQNLTDAQNFSPYVNVPISLQILVDVQRCFGKLALGKQLNWIWKSKIYLAGANFYLIISTLSQLVAKYPLYLSKDSTIHKLWHRLIIIMLMLWLWQAIYIRRWWLNQK
jgi:hypothetical protein